MNWASLIYIVIILGLSFVFFRFGIKSEQSKRDERYKKDVDEYLEKQKVVDSFKRDNYSDDDIMSGKLLTDEVPATKQTDNEDSKNVGN